MAKRFMSIAWANSVSIKLCPGFSFPERFDPLICSATRSASGAYFSGVNTEDTELVTFCALMCAGADIHDEAENCLNWFRRVDC